ncbi:tRNA 2'-phosphotransferase 1-like [Oscarella lobularis]|uniref:tRNA 2'-phosphotransferase 1-like n=1 Tax=Oscarella lobularis TaxID=121494 RepID=UPI003313DBDD
MAGRKRKEDSPDVKLSKALSYLLRHGAEKEGIKLGDGGYAYLDEILKLPNFHKKKWTESDVERVVANNDKQRYAMRSEVETGRKQIRANQGHTISVVDEELLTPITEPEDVPVAVHGTYVRCWDSIKRQGLSRMKRNHIHMAAGEIGDEGIVSGMRKGCQVIIRIDAAKAIKDGLKFYRSANGVILSPGDEAGFIPPKYFESAVQIKGKRRIPLEWS